MSVSASGNETFMQNLSAVGHILADFPITKSRVKNIPNVDRDCKLLILSISCMSIDKHKHYKKL